MDFKQIVCVVTETYLHNSTILQLLYSPTDWQIVVAWPVYFLYASGKAETCTFCASVAISIVCHPPTLTILSKKSPAEQAASMSHRMSG